MIIIMIVIIYNNYNSGNDCYNNYTSGNDCYNKYTSDIIIGIMPCTIMSSLSCYKYILSNKCAYNNDNNITCLYYVYNILMTQ